ncbi:peroxide stress protein YaaA [Xinfangfangia sp. CPCC 101601]|uniref:UPF0246 protein Q9295_08935 n=1 Tax=Pseudogemmobacter lacusdianii TaxID=3069608 RepID=A0ABU0VXP4_9RHOB|nr:peroxide stress protein YaaA [Xinfangfangia sp. CPCC 101601]MDQ2066497.1 peroxide stress protein YaaA [Xinfangfangia sp. CPCC 101601]
MLCVLSPAKKLDEKPKNLAADVALTQPQFLTETAALVQRARELTVQDLRKLMHLSEPLAVLNRDRFAAYQDSPEAPLPALHAFAGDTYVGLDAASMSEDSRHWAKGHLRILSGLYGLLRPWDAIQAHRLEMGTKLSNPRGPDLYAFWGDRVAEALNAQAEAVGTDILVNCASTEYFTTAKRKALNLRVITPVFLEERGNEAKVISFWAKKARGSMARYLCDHHLTDPQDLRDFGIGGYGYRPDLSEGDRMVFSRAEP